MDAVCDRSLLLGGSWVDRDDVLDVRDPEDGSLVGRTAVASVPDAELAVTLAETSSPLPRAERAAVLQRAAERVDERAQELAETIAREGIKTIREARREVARCATTLRLAAGEALTMAGEEVPFDAIPGREYRIGGWTRVALGVVVAITPFNDPLNLVAHKIAPAVAAGNPVIVKPHEQTPLSALGLAQAFVDAGLPPGWLQVLPARGPDVAQALVRDPRVRMVSFTGGQDVAVRIAAIAGVKRLTMELGSNCATIVCADADLDLAVPAITGGAFSAAGQNCLHVQRVLIAREVYDALAGRLIAAAGRVRLGRKLDEDTDMGPLVGEPAAVRIDTWLHEATVGGGNVLAGGERSGTRMAPTLVEGVARTTRLYRDEIFGPVTILEPFDTLAEAIDVANSVDLGLQHAVFTRSLDHALTAVHGLKAGGIMVNDSSDFRDDSMPFGGSGRSGIGREGVRFAIAEMTQPKLVCIARGAPESADGE